VAFREVTGTGTTRLTVAALAPAQARAGVCYTLCYFDRLSDLPLKTRRFPLKPAWILDSKAIDATQCNAHKPAKTQS
jgi:hypothetical protein